MRKCLVLTFTLLLLLCTAALAEDLGFTVIPEVLRPGKTERISFATPVDGTARIELRDAQHQTLLTIRESIPAVMGENHLTWNGYDADGNAIAPGAYFLYLSIDGRETYAALDVGDLSPQIQQIQAETYMAGYWEVQAQCNMPGTLILSIRIDEAWQVIKEIPAQTGMNSTSWDGLLNGEAVAMGSYSVQLKLSDAQGYTGNAIQITLEIGNVPTPPPQPTPTPAPTATPQPTHHEVIPSKVSKPEETSNYWTLPIGVFDEAAIWEVMMQPLTVIWGDDPRNTYKLRLTPDTSTKRSNIVGEITFQSQGVNILETRDDGWSLVEGYNSSYGPDCTSRPGYGNTNEIIQGYVKTSLLKVLEPKTEYGLLIDKLDQKMYIFQGGKIIGTLLVSTGEPTSKQPWNETPSGEFVVQSHSGGFYAGNLYCDYGMRINGGCLMHEVPCIINETTGYKDYSSTIPKLGSRASHGCIRIQKAENEQGQNIKWIWDNIKNGTKVLIWEDSGRYMDYPADDLAIYYNPEGGKYYHTDQYCSSVKDRYLPLKEFTYGELETGDYKKLTYCPYCEKVMRKTEIDALNKKNGF